MNVTVTMLQSGRTDDWGRPLVAGSSYSLDFDRAKSLWQAGFASVADPAIFEDDNTPVGGAILRTTRFADFRRSLLASLVVSSTAARTNGLVTVTAAAHGITTGTLYTGFRFFYPGSASLAAGWYDSIGSVPTANTLTFYAPGSDFGSESVNGGAAYTTTTTVQGQTVIPGGTLGDNSALRLSVVSGGGLTAAIKTIRPLVNGTSLSQVTATGFPFCARDFDIVSNGPTSLICNFIQYNGGASSFTTVTVDRSLDIPVQLQLTVSAAADFVLVYPPARLHFII